MPDTFSRLARQHDRAIKRVMNEIAEIRDSGSCIRVKPFRSVNSTVRSPITMRRGLITFAGVIMVACAALAVLRPFALISAVGEWKKCVCRYEHIETTGLMDTVTFADGTSKIIQFTPDSDAKALAALDHISRFMIFGTSDDKRTIGSSPFRQRISLHGEISKMGSDGFLYGDKFYWFRLNGWTLEVPFDIQIPSEQDADGMPAVQSCSTFAEASVGNFIVDGKAIPLNPFLIHRK